MCGDFDRPLNTSRGLSAIAEFLIFILLYFAGIPIATHKKVTEKRRKGQDCQIFIGQGSSFVNSALFLYHNIQSDRLIDTRGNAIIRSIQSVSVDSK